MTTNPDFLLSEPAAFPLVRAGSTTNGQIGIASLDGFNAAVNLSCSLNAGSNNCSVGPASVSSYPATATVTVDAASLSAGSYQLTVQGTSGAIAHALAFPVQVGDYQLTGPQALTVSPGAQVQVPLSIIASTYYSGQINATCDASALPGALCTFVPVNPIAVSTGATVALAATLSVPNDAAPGGYAIHINSQDTTGEPVHNLTVQVTIGQDYTISQPSPATQTISAGQSASYNFSVFPVGATYDSQITLKCIVAPVFLGNCTFSPNPVPPMSNSTSTAVIMNVTTQATTGELVRPGATTPTFYFALMLLPALLLGSAKKRRASLMLTFATCLAFLLLLPSCGGGGNGDITKRHNGTTPGTYTITIVGTPASASQPLGQATTLIVQ